MRILPLVLSSATSLMILASAATMAGDALADGRSSSPTYSKLLSTKFKYVNGATASPWYAPGPTTLSALTASVTCPLDNGCGLDADLSITWSSFDTPNGVNFCVYVDALVASCHADEAVDKSFQSTAFSVFKQVAKGSHTVQVRAVPTSFDWRSRQMTAQYSVYGP